MNKDIQGKKPILFVLSIDTEEEWDWSGPFPQRQANVENITHIPEFHAAVTAMGIRPTYFVDYAVLETESSVKNMRYVHAKNDCEIGAHIHPWCNPPYFKEVGEAESHVINLPVHEVDEKLQALVSKIKSELDVTPKSFRSGRWGIDSNVLNLLIKNGFDVDSSVYPYYKNEFFSCLGAPSTPYWPGLDNPLTDSEQRQIYEVPVTVGFNRKNFDFCNTIHTAFTYPNLSWTRFNGFAWHTKILRKNYLCPELSSVEDMTSLCDMVVSKAYPVLHMYMHSSSLLDNKNSFLGKANAFNHICGAIEQVTEHLKNNYDVEFCTISESAKKLQA